MRRTPRCLDDPSGTAEQRPLVGMSRSLFGLPLIIVVITTILNIYYYIGIFHQMVDVGRNSGHFKFQVWVS